MTYFVIDADSDEGTSHPESFRDAPLGAGPESILSIVVMDSGLALRAPRNDGLIFIRDTSGICSRCRVVICPSGGFLTGLSSLISDFPKNISVPTHPKSPLELFVSHPRRGAYHDRHERGLGCGGRGSVLRAMGSQGESQDL
jgi:hypothetical protein